MNKSCVSCASSKLRCDLGTKGSPCSRCMDKHSPCVRAGRKKRTSKKKATTTTTITSPVPSPQTSSQNTNPRPPHGENANLPFIGTPSVGDIDLSQLVDIESMFDMSSWTWSPEDMTSILGETDMPQSRGSWPGSPEIPVTREGFLCPDTFRLPPDYTLVLDSPETIPVHRLETFARLFFSRFHSFISLFHIPTFCLASSAPVLVRTICFIGAGFDRDPSSASEARLMYGSLPTLLAKCCLFSNGTSPTFEELQALVLLQFATVANGGSAERAAARLLHPFLVAAIRHEGLLKIHGECTRAAWNAQFWQPWIQKESSKRVLWGVYAVDCYQSILCGSKPLLSPTDTRASFPCDDESWNACLASLWATLPAQDPSSCFLSSVKDLMMGQAPAKSNMTMLGMNLLILAANALLLEAQTSVLPVDTSALDQALQTWFTSWEQFQGQSHIRPVGTANFNLISNSLSLYYFAVHFLRNGRPVLDNQAYLEASVDSRNPLIIREQAYQEEMTRCVERILGDFQEV
ncbi:hypothetical protein NCS52_00593100 [Fusarium sp. LHS14.1]|nr:hypothetical protein NCS52_00593100 [Fusarium sp. LHS14.1]